ncbi:MAG: hypothetical protein GOU98_01080 [Candidatus Altiarchaeota archaeon]|nr:hypothetical protein [Candidatus Altiarchaeota archaeon]
MYGLLDAAALKLLPFFGSFVLVFVFAIFGLIFASFIHTAFEAAQGNKRLGITLIVLAFMFLPIFNKYKNIGAVLGYFSVIGLVLFLRMLIITFKKVNLIVKE